MPVSLLSSVISTNCNVEKPEEDETKWCIQVGTSLEMASRNATMTYLIYPNLCTTSKPSLRRGNKTGNNTSVSDRVQKLLIIPLSRFTSQPL